MKTFYSLASLLLIAALAGCASTESRISDNKAAFNSWPSEVQASVRAGKVKLGFTPEQVKMAMGEPNRVYSRQSKEGEAEVWAYFDKKPGISFGLGMSSGSYSGVGGGVGVNTRGDRADEALRVIFESGKVVGIESRSDK